MSDDFSSDIYTKGQLVVGHSATGNFETLGDSDWFHLQLSAGVTYVIGFNGLVRGDDGNAAPDYLWMALMDGLGQVLSSRWGSDSLGASLTFTANRSGDYLFNVGGDATNTGAYRVTAALPAADDFRADASGSPGYQPNTLEGMCRCHDPYLME